MLKEELVAWMLVQFEAMGATKAQLKTEKRLMEISTEYLIGWLCSMSNIDNHLFPSAYEA